MWKSGSIAMVALVCLTFVAGGCVMKSGRFVPNSDFAQPGCTVQKLGHVQASVIKKTSCFRPKITPQEAKAAYRDALSQAEGANILLNYSEDTTLIRWWPFKIYTMEYWIEGEAAKIDPAPVVLPRLRAPKAGTPKAGGEGARKG